MAVASARPSGSSSLPWISTVISRMPSDSFTVTSGIGVLGAELFQFGAEVFDLGFVFGHEAVVRSDHAVLDLCRHAEALFWRGTVPMPDPLTRVGCYAFVGDGFFACSQLLHLGDLRVECVPRLGGGVADVVPAAASIDAEGVGEFVSPLGEPVHVA